MVPDRKDMWSGDKLQMWIIQRARNGSTKKQFLEANLISHVHLPAICPALEFVFFSFSDHKTSWMQSVFPCSLFMPFSRQAEALDPHKDFGLHKFHRPAPNWKGPEILQHQPLFLSGRFAEKQQRADVWAEIRPCYTQTRLVNSRKLATEVHVVSPEPNPWRCLWHPEQLPFLQHSINHDAPERLHCKG